MFDVDSGQVLSAMNARENLRVASTFKILTALVVRAHVPLTTMVPISARADAVPPLKLTMEPGSHWQADGLLHAMLIASINDAAVALAERSGGGSLDGFVRVADREAVRLRLADHPVLRDPAGLDDETSFRGGNFMSARDLAITTRAFLSDPLLSSIVQLPKYDFPGGDGKDHVVYNHNAFLQIYPGAIGVKTGYTQQAGHCLVAAATRDGRTLGIVVIGSTNPVGVATDALDAGFVTPPAPAAGAVDTLPSPRPDEPPAPVKDASPAKSRAAEVPTRSRGRSPALPVMGAAAVVIIGAGTIVRRDRRGKHRRRNRSN